MKPLIVANWKMNPQNPRQAEKLFESIKKGVKNLKKAETVLCPPFVFLPLFSSRKGGIRLGAQNVFFEEKGAFTGEISSAMLKSLGVSFVILGHSERRKHFGEDGKLVAKKVKAVKKAGLKPIVCVDKALQAKSFTKDTILAFEPLSAIGTGRPYSFEVAKKARKNLSGFKTVLYGGSVDSGNASGYIEKSGFQGLLVGGASLKPSEFVKIVKAADNF